MPLYTVTPSAEEQDERVVDRLIVALDPCLDYWTGDDFAIALTEAGLAVRVISPPRLLDFPSANQALLHVARQAFDVKLVTSVSAAARLLAAGVKIETADGEPVGVVTPPPAETGETHGEEDPPIEGEAEFHEQEAAEPAEPSKPRRGRPRKNTPPAAAAAPPADDPAPEAALRPATGDEPPAASEGLLAAEAERVAASGGTGLFEKMSALARNNSPAPTSLPPEVRAKEGAAIATRAAPEIAPGAGFDAAGKQEGAAARGYAGGRRYETDD